MNVKVIVFIIALAVMASLVVGIFSLPLNLPSTPAENDVDIQENRPSDGEDFVFNLYSEVAKQNPDSNLFFSPLGISMAFSAAYEGAEGDTANQLQRVFDFEPDDQKRAKLMESLIGNLNSKDEHYKLEVANGLWIKENYEIKDQYIETVTKSYNGTAENVNFETDDGINRINGWVKEKTRGKIQDILSPGSTDEFTRMVITNAVYFNGKWALQFNPQNTSQEKFWINDEKSVDVMMMNQPADVFHYAETEDLQALQMYYLGGDVSMLILLPKERDGIESMEMSLDMKKLEMLYSMLERKPMSVQIPKFEFETEYDLVVLMQNLGVYDAFDKNNAQFGRITDEQIYIDKAKHKAFVGVDEEGTEAAAITALVMRPSSGPPEPQIEFVADHPFVFLIQEKETGQILFIGRMMDPTQ